MEEALTLRLPRQFALGFRGLRAYEGLGHVGLRAGTRGPKALRSFGACGRRVLRHMRGTEGSWVGVQGQGAHLLLQPLLQSFAVPRGL